MSEAYTLTRDQLETVLRSTYAAGEQAGESPLSAAGDERRFRRTIDAAVARAAEYTVRKPTNETTPDAVAMLQWMHACVVHSENHGDVPRIGSDEVLAVLRATQDERARHAEEVARLRDVHLDETRALDDLRLKEIASLRDQLRKVEGERDALAVRMDLPASQLLMVGSELCGDGKIDPNDHRDPRWTPTLQQAAKVMRELTSIRALLPDVRACAEYIVERGVDNADGSARRILAALASQGGEGECLDRSDARGVAGDRCESGNECGRLGCPECQS